MKENIKNKRELNLLQMWEQVWLKTLGSGHQNVKYKKDLIKNYASMAEKSLGSAYKNFNAVKQYFVVHKVGNKVHLTLAVSSEGSILINERIYYLINKLNFDRPLIPEKKTRTVLKPMKQTYVLNKNKPTSWSEDMANLYRKAKDEYETMKSEQLSESQSKIAKKCGEITQFLLAKNKQYGDSALSPIRIFSSSDEVEQLRVRIDDKLNRLLQGNADIEKDEDVIKDLIGYLVLLLISMESNS